jgi:hypothetical protein
MHLYVSVYAYYFDVSSIDIDVDIDITVTLSDFKLELPDFEKTGKYPHTIVKQLAKKRFSNIKGK